MFTGIRVSEALNASTTNYGHETGHRTLTVRRKGGTVAKEAVPAPAVKALNAYLGTTGQELVTAAGEGLPLFTTATGKRWALSDTNRIPSPARSTWSLRRSPDFSDVGNTESNDLTELLTAGANVELAT